MIADGIHPALPRDRYDSIERVNFSCLKHMAKSPKHYRHALLNPPEDTDPMRLGRVTHVATFEPERFRNSIAVWDGPRRAGKDWEAFKQRNEGKELLTEDQHARCMAIQAAVRADADAQKYLQNGRGEVSMLWTASANETGEEIACKGRIDFDTADALVDLKTTKDAGQGAFGRQAAALNYHTQFAWYSDGYFRVTGIRKPYVVIAVESEPPHDVVVYHVPDVAISVGRERYDHWLDQLAFCRAHSLWPGRANGVELELTLPAWALPADGKDASGLGLEFDTTGGD